MIFSTAATHSHSFAAASSYKNMQVCGSGKVNLGTIPLHDHLFMILQSLYKMTQEQNPEGFQHTNF